MTIKQTIKQYRQIKNTIKQSTTIRLTATATATDGYIKDDPHTLAECIALKPRNRTRPQKKAPILDTLTNDYIAIYTDENGDTKRIFFGMDTDDIKAAYKPIKEIVKSDNVRIYYNFMQNTDLIELQAKSIVRRTALNMVMREGIKTQYDIFNAVNRKEWDHPDVCDLIQVAALALFECIAVNDLNAVKMQVYTLRRTKNALKHLNPVIDIDAINNIINAAAVYCPDISTDYRKNDRRVKMLEWLIAAVENNDTAAAVHYAYLALNHYLADNRAIRSDIQFISLENEDQYYNENDDTILNMIDIDPYEVEKRRLYLKAFSRTIDTLSDTCKKTYKLLIKGYTVNQIAARRGINHGTICKHKDTIAATFIHSLQNDENAAAVQNLIENNAVILDIENAAAALKSENVKTVENAAAKNAQKSIIRDQLTVDCLHRALSECLEKLTPDEHKVYTALIDNGYSIRTAAAALNMSKSTVDRLKTKIQLAIIDIIKINTPPENDIDFDTLKKLPLIDLVKTI